MLPSPVGTVLEVCFGQKGNLYLVMFVCFPLKPSVWLLKSGGFLSTSRDLDAPASLVSFSHEGFSSSKSDSLKSPLSYRFAFIYS